MNQFRKGRVQLNPLWDDLYKIVSYGFSRTKIKDGIYRIAAKGEVIFQAPSYLKKFNDNNGQYLLVLGQNMNIREKPSTKSAIVGQVTFQKLKYNDPMTSLSRTAFNYINSKQWYEVNLPDGRTGYVIEDYLSVPVIKELSVKKIDGQWKIISFYNPPPKC